MWAYLVSGRTALISLKAITWSKRARAINVHSDWSHPPPTPVGTQPQLPAAGVTAAAAVQSQACFLQSLLWFHLVLTTWFHLQACYRGLTEDFTCATAAGLSRPVVSLKTSTHICTASPLTICDTTMPSKGRGRRPLLSYNDVYQMKRM